MTLATLRRLLQKQPFQPFELILSSGDRFAIRHPELLLLLKEYALVAVELEDGDDPEDFRIVSYLHVAATEPLRNKRRKKAS